MMLAQANPSSELRISGAALESSVTSTLVFYAALCAPLVDPFSCELLDDAHDGKALRAVQLKSSYEYTWRRSC
jgi:hypothetical protein